MIKKWFWGAKTNAQKMEIWPDAADHFFTVFFPELGVNHFFTVFLKTCKKNGTFPNQKKW